MGDKTRLARALTQAGDDALKERVARTHDKNKTVQNAEPLKSKSEREHDRFMRQSHAQRGKAGAKAITDNGFAEGQRGRKDLRR